jgi:hypothetical protein
MRSAGAAACANLGPELMNREDGAHPVSARRGGRRRAPAARRQAPGPDTGGRCDDLRSYLYNSLPPDYDPVVRMAHRMLAGATGTRRAATGDRCDDRGGYLYCGRTAHRAVVWPVGGCRAPTGRRHTPDRDDSGRCDDVRSYLYNVRTVAWLVGGRRALTGRRHAAGRDDSGRCDDLRSYLYNVRMMHWAVAWPVGRRHAPAARLHAPGPDDGGKCDDLRSYPYNSLPEPAAGLDPVGPRPGGEDSAPGVGMAGGQMPCPDGSPARAWPGRQRQMR